MQNETDELGIAGGIAGICEQIKDSDLRKVVSRHSEDLNKTFAELIERVEKGEQKSNMAHWLPEIRNQQLTLVRLREIESMEAFECLVHISFIAGAASAEISGTDRLIDRAISARAADLGAKGAKKRFAPMRELEAWAVKKYQEGNWRSANQASHDLKASVIAHGRSIGAHLSEQNAKDTIYRWLLKSQHSG